MIRVADGVSPAVRADLGDMDESLGKQTIKGSRKILGSPLIICR